MNFLTPLFLLGGFAIALPIVFHLIRRTTRERALFSSLMFLRPSPPRLTRRSKLENILLLVLRCAVICLLALGFARPFFKSPALNLATKSSSKRVFLLIDSSASMRRANLWEAARDKARSIIRSLSASDQAALYTFDRELHPLLTFEQWNTTAPENRSELALQKLSEAKPGWSATQLGGAVIRAAEMLADNPMDAAAPPGEIVIITDFQDGARLEGLQGYEWPKHVGVRLEALKAPKTSNASGQLVTALGEADSNT